ncbi:NAD(P)/FAD-dependent oxidoreductase [Sphingobium subterraneum]|uniref:Flavin-dependent dehydrogenase n=1 Tax=Sphingobium subterraneum TaxID=627688 RepID=A0A841J7D8_9SPHN|nr:FAD-dependent monooxygenase [Sphingobium subterraneum]MBB6124101.1 flavin-dependent dehydrogenase [Sphingobium subterraneum]
MRRTHPLIIGGGPAGAAAAIHLARAGAQPLLLEKTRETGDALCGGFLSWATLAQIAALGVDPAQLGGQRVAHLGLFTPHRSVRVPLPAPAMGVSRQRLDTHLLDAAEQAGAQVRRGTVVRLIDDDRTVILADGEIMSADSIFLATGKQELRGATRDTGPIGNPALGLRVRLAPHPALQAMIGDAIELHLFRGGYLGIVLQEDGSANACLAITKSRFAAARGRPTRLLEQLADASPALADRFAYLPTGAQIDAVGHIPYGWRSTDTREGLFRLGDQAAVIPSLAGEGIGIALASATRAAEAWQKRGAQGARGYQVEFARAARAPIRWAGLMRDILTQPPFGAIALSLAGRAPSLVAAVAQYTRIIETRP